MNTKPVKTQSESSAPTPRLRKLRLRRRRNRLRRLLAFASSGFVVVGAVCVRTATDQRQRPRQLVGLDQHFARLGSLTGPDDATGLHQVHQPAGLGETDSKLALQ